MFDAVRNVVCNVVMNFFLYYDRFGGSLMNDFWTPQMSLISG